ncbi:MAG: hypothetical protein IKI24_02020 [Clostridia bacterium]|nr:hypothetical protein [Clostridia bacterium]
MLSNVDISFHPSWWHKHAGINFDEGFFFDAPRRVEDDRDMRRALYEHFGEFGIGEKDPLPRPILFSDLLAAGFLYSQLMGCEVEFTKGDAPQVLRAELDDDAASRLKAPDLGASPLWQKVESQIRYLQDRFGSVESAINLQGIQNIALDLRGPQLMYDYYDDPDLAHHLLSEATKLSLDIGRRLYAVSPVVSGGVTSIIKQALPGVYLTSNCSVTMISCKMYREFLLEYDTLLANAFPVFGIHHCGSNMESVIEGYLDVPNLKFIEIGAGSDLDKIARALAARGRRDMLCNVRYSPVKIKTADRDTIKADTDAAVAAFGSDENLFFSCVGIDADTADEHIKAYLSVFKENESC